MNADTLTGIAIIMSPSVLGLVYVLRGCHWLHTWAAWEGYRILTRTRHKDMNIWSGELKDMGVTEVMEFWESRQCKECGTTQRRKQKVLGR